MASAVEGKKALVPSSSRDGEAKKPRRRMRVLQQIPKEILEDPELKEAMKILPKNYSFEVPKTIWRLKSAKSKRVALQFPEGLLMYSCILSDIISKFAGVETVIMGDVTYGACCVDDLSATALGCDFVVHYGHSCLVPVDPNGFLKMLYVFVEISIDVNHLCSSLQASFKAETKVHLAGTIQFTAALRTARTRLKSYFTHMAVPQAKPLSPGEVLGCTAPKLPEGGVVVFVADGRFHLESLMIMNPQVEHFYKYDPYSRKLTQERYDYKAMFKLRLGAISQAQGAKTFGLILGSLGRQGNPKIIDRLKKMFEAEKKSVVVVLLSEIFPAKLELFANVDAWVQVACPRLSIDWGHAFTKPLLSPYEAEVALGKVQWQQVYPMDFYSKGGGPWSNYHPEVTRTLKTRRAKTGRRRRVAPKIAYEKPKIGS